MHTASSWRLRLSRAATAAALVTAAVLAPVSASAAPAEPVPLSVRLLTPTTDYTVWSSGTVTLDYEVVFDADRPEITRVDTSQITTTHNGSTSVEFGGITGGDGLYHVSLDVTGEGVVSLLVASGFLTFSDGSVSSPRVSDPALIEGGTAPYFSTATLTISPGYTGGVGIAVGGDPVPTITADGALPEGAYLSDGTLYVADLPVGEYAVPLKAVNPLGEARQTFNLRVVATAFTSPSSATFSSSTPGSFAVTWVAPLGAALTGYDNLPTGLNATLSDGRLLISGMPDRSAAGVTHVGLTLTSFTEEIIEQDLAITINANPVVTSGTAFTPVVGTPFEATVTTSGWPAPVISTKAPLPAGLQLTDNGDGTATISGTPTGHGGYIATAAGAENSTGTTIFDLRFSITEPPAAPPVIQTVVPFSVSVGNPFEYTVKAFGYPTPTLTATTLPDGITFTDHGDGTGVLAGAVTSPGFTQTRIVAANELGTYTATWNVTANAAPSFTSPAAAAFQIGAESSFTVRTSAYPIAAISVDGDLPDGLTLHDNRNGTVTISGVATEAFDEDLRLVATNNRGTAEQILRLESWAPPVFSDPTATTAEFTAGSAGSFTVAASGTPTPALTLVGDLPEGLSFQDNGDGTATIAGTPAADAAGDFPVTVTAQVTVTGDAELGLAALLAAAEDPTTATHALVVSVAAAAVDGGPEGSDGGSGGSDGDGPSDGGGSSHGDGPSDGGAVDPDRAGAAVASGSDASDALAATGGSSTWPVVGLGLALLVGGVLVRRRELRLGRPVAQEHPAQR